ACGSPAGQRAPARSGSWGRCGPGRRPPTGGGCRGPCGAAGRRGGGGRGGGRGAGAPAPPGPAPAARGGRGGPGRGGRGRRGARVRGRGGGEGLVEGGDLRGGSQVAAPRADRAGQGRGRRTDRVHVGQVVAGEEGEQAVLPVGERPEPDGHRRRRQ